MQGVGDLEDQRAVGFSRKNTVCETGLVVNNKEIGTTAIVTGYLVGTTTGPDGTATQVRNQRTGVLIKQGGQWKEVHRHLSPVRLPQ